jgi:hypothetical protein
MQRMRKSGFGACCGIGGLAAPNSGGNIRWDGSLRISPVWNLRLIVEADGGQHADDEDASRTEWLGKHGWSVIRFWNNEILQNPEGVWTTILRAVEDTPLPLAGEEAVRRAKHAVA